MIFNIFKKFVFDIWFYLNCEAYKICLSLILSSHAVRNYIHANFSFIKNDLCLPLITAICMFEHKLSSPFNFKNDQLNQILLLLNHTRMHTHVQAVGVCTKTPSFTYCKQKKGKGKCSAYQRTITLISI